MNLILYHSLSSIGILGIAYLLDLLIGDPRFLPHPVVLMGKCITWLERLIRHFVKTESRLKGAGLLFPILLVGGSYIVVWGILRGLAWIHPLLSWVAEAWLISTTIATKGLADAGIGIYRKLQSQDLVGARKALSMVVGRDTDQLDVREVARGAVETVAENIVDAIISPLLYAAIGGAPLAMAYRAANTLDSMVGYKNAKYKNLGWASARFDDLVNYIPARLAAIVLVIVSWMMRLDWQRCRRVMIRDARKHPSPNSGFTEAGVAGALGIQVGGINYYQGVRSHRAELGDSTRPISEHDIVSTVAIMKRVSILFLLICFIGIVVGDQFIHFLNE